MEKGKRKNIYFYGTGIPLDYEGEIPKGFEIREFPASDYLVFSYPTFDFMSENADVMRAVEELGYQVLKPVKRLTGNYIITIVDHLS